MIYNESQQNFNRNKGKDNKFNKKSSFSKCKQKLIIQNLQSSYLTYNHRKWRVFYNKYVKMTEDGDYRDSINKKTKKYVKRIRARSKMLNFNFYAF